MRFLSFGLLTLMVMFPTIAEAEETHIAVASNFADAMDELTDIYEEQSAHDLIVSYGSTGKLYGQIVNGAPFDIFLAADEERPRLLEQGARAASPPYTYAIGQIVLWAPSRSDISPEDLREQDFRRLAIANPDLAPYGVAAIQVLAALKLDVGLEAKLVRGENIGQVFSFISTGNAELGFIAKSQYVFLSPEMKGASWQPPQEMYDPVRQNAVLLTRGSENEAALGFMTFLQTEDAKKIIRRYGYETE